MPSVAYRLLLLALALLTPWAAAQDLTYPETKSIYLQQVGVPGGLFVLGNTGATAGASYELPAHEVMVAPFAIGVHEVTQAQYEAVMGYNPSHHRGPALPVERVSWYDAVRFCNALSLLEGLTPAYQLHPFDGYIVAPEANGFRLPTEAEWEYAAKAGTTTDTYAGDLTTAEGTDPGLDAIAWYLTGTSPASTHPVGQKLPNAFGLYDAIGNVFEWTDSVFEAYPGGTIDSDAPGGPLRGASLKVLRGGAMDTAPLYSRAAYRYNLHPSYTSYNIGFRIVRSISQSDDE